MKIESSVTAVRSTQIKGAPSSAAGKSKSASSDDVRLSTLATQLSSGTDNDTPFDAARVAEIKQAIASGQFTINAGAISDRLIASAKEMINTAR